MRTNHVPVSQTCKPWPAYFLVRTTGEVVPLIAVDELPTGTNLVGVPRSLDLEDTIGMLNLGLQRSSGAFYQLVSAHEVKSQAVVASTGKLCRHWCHHGMCKWGQQCRYRHIMPMSTSGLQEVGLGDWPLWFRRLNPGYFAAENSHPTSNNTRAGGRDARVMRQSVKACMSAGGNGVACCGVLNGPGGGRERARPREIHGLRERSVRDRAERGGFRVVRNEELGGQIIARLRTMKGEQPAKGADKERGERGLSSNSLIERAAVRDTKNWEEESEGSGQSEQGQEKGEAGKLVDV
ncbi:unnamed protein product [Diplocarpon coronariae]